MSAMTSRMEQLSQSIAEMAIAIHSVTGQAQELAGAQEHSTEAEVNHMARSVADLAQQI
ncbi:hypothetical protein [Paenibacillus wenxiniae]|uniref:Methyl-accepting chemotaxis protein n=1 Tax=Paenibacillus wenxiniae TaxID=1636843 RepID=A0ABW4RMQ2_9BACL